MKGKKRDKKVEQKGEEGKRTNEKKKGRETPERKKKDTFVEIFCDIALCK